MAIMVKAVITTFASFISFSFLSFSGGFAPLRRAVKPTFQTATTSRRVLRDKSFFNAFSDLAACLAIFSGWLPAKAFSCVTAFFPASNWYKEKCGLTMEKCGLRIADRGNGQMGNEVLEWSLPRQGPRDSARRFNAGDIQ
jgi:hypothetical protein